LYRGQYWRSGEEKQLTITYSVGSAISDWTLDAANPGIFSYNQNITFSMSKPGPNAVRQDSPHEHEAILGKHFYFTS
jgi:hypothetical protein